MHAVRSSQENPMYTKSVSDSIRHFFLIVVIDDLVDVVDLDDVVLSVTFYISPPSIPGKKIKKRSDTGE